MKNPRSVLVAVGLLFALVGCSNLDRQAAPQQVSKASVSTSGEKREILALFDQWNQSLATGNPSKVATNYASDSILIPTVSNRVRRTNAERIDYFEHFLSEKPQGKIDEAHVRVYGDIAVNSGLYTFTFRDGSVVHARYTFVYQKQRDGRWLIIEHHSSKLPE